VSGEWWGGEERAAVSRPSPDADWASCGEAAWAPVAGRGRQDEQKATKVTKVERYR